jgi:hypothetical protein
MIARMKKTFWWLVLLGGVLVSLAVLWQAFSIAAYVRGAGEGTLDAHGLGSIFVHLGQLAIVIGALIVFWGNWPAVGTAIGFLVLSVAQLAFLGNTDEEGGWLNGLHGFLALIVLLAGLAYAQRAARELGLRSSSGAAGGA